jgi:hypothetical protein
LVFPRSDAGVGAAAFAQCARTIGPTPTHLLLTAEIVNERLAEARSIRYALSADLMLRFLMTPNLPVAFVDQSVGDRDHDGNSIAGRRISEFLQGLFDREQAGPLARRKLLEARQMLGHDRLRWNDHKRMLNEPSHAVARFILRSLEGIGSQVEQFGQAQLHQWLGPDIETMRSLLQECRLPLIIAQASKVAVVSPVEKLAAG